MHTHVHVMYCKFELQYLSLYFKGLWTALHSLKSKIAS